MATPTVKTEVTMENGSKVEFSNKKQMLKKIEDKTVTFNFRNGRVLSYTLPDNDDFIIKLALHGASQKIGDEAAGREDIEDMILEVQNMIDRANKFEWATPRVVGSGFNGASQVIKAICQVSGKTDQEVKDYIEKKLTTTAGLTRGALYASFRKPGTKTGDLIAAWEAEKAVAKGGLVSSDDLLSEIAE